MRKPKNWSYIYVLMLTTAVPSLVRSETPCWNDGPLSTASIKGYSDFPLGSKFETAKQRGTWTKSEDSIGLTVYTMASDGGKEAFAVTTDKAGSVIRTVYVKRLFNNTELSVGWDDFKKILFEKYGKPQSYCENWQYPYTENDFMDHGSTALSLGKATFISIWKDNLEAGLLMRLESDHIRLDYESKTYIKISASEAKKKEDKY